MLSYVMMENGIATKEIASDDPEVQQHGKQRSEALEAYVSNHELRVQEHREIE